MTDARAEAIGIIGAGYAERDPKLVEHVADAITRAERRGERRGEVKGMRRAAALVDGRSFMVEASILDEADRLEKSE